MAAITGVYGAVRPLSLAYQLTMTGAADTQSNADLLTTSGLSALPATVPVSGLVTFLKTVFASNVAADTAFRALGGEIVIRQTGGTATSAPVIGWANANATPSLTIVGSAASNEVFEIVMRVPHSIVS